MVKCIFTDGAECCKCVICNHDINKPKIHEYTCVSCGYKGETEKEAYWFEECPKCGGIVGFKPCPAKDMVVN